MSDQQAPVDSGWAQLLGGLTMRQKEHEALEEKLREGQHEIDRRRQEAERSKNEELRQKNISLGEECEKWAREATSLKSEKAALEVAHKQAFSVQRKKLIEANAAFVTAYQDAEELRRKLADAMAENVAYRKVFAMRMNVGKEVSKAGRDESAEEVVVDDRHAMEISVSTPIERDRQAQIEEENGPAVSNKARRCPTRTTQKVPTARRGTRVKASALSIECSSTAHPRKLCDNGEIPTGNPVKKRGRHDNDVLASAQR